MNVQVDWLIGRSVGRWVGRSVGRWVGRSVGRSVGGSVSRPVGRSVCRSVDGSVGCFDGWLIGTPTKFFIVFVQASCVSHPL